MSTNTVAYLLFLGLCGCSILLLACTEFFRQFFRPHFYDVERNLNSIKAGDESTRVPRTLPCLPSRPSTPHPPPPLPDRIIEISKSCIDCAVCQGPLEFDDGSAVETAHKTLPLCGHKFHKACIVGWLEKTATCPVCRRVYPFPSRLRFKCLA